MPYAPIEAIKDLLTGSIWDKFKEMIEPYALVNAIVFLALNLALVYPAMGTLAGNPFFTTLAGASDIWKLAAGTIVLFVFSYLINHLSSFSLDFASGEIFRDSPIIGKQLRKWQKGRYNKLEREAKKRKVPTDEIRYKRDKAAFRLAYEFPVKETELGLTRLGNLLLNPSSYVAHQYGASMQLAWPILQGKLNDDDKNLKSVQGNWTALLFFSSLYGLLIFIAIELICVSFFGGQGIDVWQIVVLLAFAGICYYASLEEARQWGGGMRHVFDSHVREFFADLGMDGLKDLTPASSEFNSSWEDVLSWLAYGAVGGDEYLPQQKWYVADPKPVPEEWPKLKKPAFLNVEVFPRFTRKEQFSKKDGEAYICVEKTVEYLFAVTNASTGENPLSGKEAYLLIQDDGVTPPDTVAGTLSSPGNDNASPAFGEIPIQGKRKAGKPAGVLFPLGDVPPGSSRVLTYSFDSVLAKVTLDVEINRVELGKDTHGQFMDIFPGPIAQEASLHIEMLDDAQTILNPCAGLYPEQEGYPPMGNMSAGGRIGDWQLALPVGLEKIRIRADQVS